MKRFTLNFTLLLSAIICLSGLVTWLLLSGQPAPAALVLIGIACAVWALYALTGRLVRYISIFASSLETGDTTIHFEVKGDRRLRKMTDTMNRIGTLYRENILQLETRKLYYDRILKVMTHEMRNSITPVASLAEDIESNPAEYTAERLAEAISIIHDQADGIIRFLDSYFQLTQLPPLARREINATEFLGHLQVLATQECAKRGLSPDVCGFIAPRDLIFNADEALLTQAAVNLIRNSLDAVTGISGAEITVTMTSSSQKVILKVEDNGCGIPDAVMDNLFEPFFSTKPGGIGVGLCLSRQIVRRHGGDITVLSREGKGTAMTMSLSIF